MWLLGCHTTPCASIVWLNPWSVIQRHFIWSLCERSLDLAADKPRELCFSWEKYRRICRNIITWKRFSFAPNNSTWLLAVWTGICGPVMNDSAIRVPRFGTYVLKCVSEGVDSQNSRRIVNNPRTDSIIWSRYGHWPIGVENVWPHRVGIIHELIDLYGKLLTDENN